MEVVPNIDKAITPYCDNSDAVANSRELLSHKRRKHIERKLREIVNRGDVTVTKIPMLDNLADLFTKTLSEKLFFKHIAEMRLKEMPHLL